MDDRLSLPQDGIQRPYHDLIGLRVTAMDNGRSNVVLDKTTELYNAFGGIHGGAIASLIDVACAMAIRSAEPGIRGSATISLSISFLDTATGHLSAEGRVTRLGNTVAATEARVTDESGKLVAQAIGSFRVIRKK
jgi:uncharacterized protein (TIGR00369 family)